MSFRENLSYELSKKEYTIKEFSKKVGISYSTILSYIDGRSYIPSADTAVKIAQELKVTVEYLVTGNSSIEKNYLQYKLFLKALNTLPESIKKNIEEQVYLLADFFSARTEHKHADNTARRI